MDKLHIRDCFQQLKSIRRLMLSLSDDLGDLSIVEARTGGTVFSTASDNITDMEHALHTMQLQLETMSRKAV